MKKAFERLSRQYGQPVVRAYLPNLRGSASKARLVANLIRNQDISLAIDRLTLSTKRAAKHILKLLNQAIANATNNHGLAASSLFVFRIVVNESRTLKRIIPVLKGGSHPIRKRSCHLEILLAERADESKQKQEEEKARLLKEFDEHASKRLDRPAVSPKSRSEEGETVAESGEVSSKQPTKDVLEGEG